jgi:hypothetical protein
MSFSWTTLSQEETLRRYKVCGARKTETRVFLQKNHKKQKSNKPGLGRQKYM